MNRNLSTIIIAIIAASVIAITTVSIIYADVCHKFITVQVGIINANSSATFVGNATLTGEVKHDSTQTNENQTYAVLAFEFNKPQCYPGHEFTGFVNDTAFSGHIKSLTSPTKINIVYN